MINTLSLVSDFGSEAEEGGWLILSHGMRCYKSPTQKKKKKNSLDNCTFFLHICLLLFKLYNNNVSPLRVLLFNQNLFVGSATYDGWSDAIFRRETGKIVMMLYKYTEFDKLQLFKLNWLHASIYIHFWHYPYLALSVPCPQTLHTGIITNSYVMVMWKSSHLKFIHVPMYMCTNTHCLTKVMIDFIFRRITDPSALKW